MYTTFFGLFLATLLSPHIRDLLFTYPLPIWASEGEVLENGGDMVHCQPFQETNPRDFGSAEIEKAPAFNEKCALGHARGRPSSLSSGGIELWIQIGALGHWSEKHYIVESERVLVTSNRVRKKTRTQSPTITWIIIASVPRLCL